MLGIAFDGRKDSTITKKNTTVKEEHYTVLSLPENKYSGHANPKSGKAEDIFGSIKELLVAR